MNKFLRIIKNDFKHYIAYGILQAVIILGLLLSLSMFFLPRLDPLLVIYITVFILPVIIFSIPMYIETEEKTIFKEIGNEFNPLVVILAKIVSALITLLIPLVMYVLVMKLFLHMNYSIVLFSMVYILSAFMHIVIGVVLAIIAKTHKGLVLSYVVYIVVFSVIPIFYTEGLIPQVSQYALVISPAYLSGILFDQIIIGYSRTSLLLTILAVVLQFVYIFVLSHFVIKTYFRSYLEHLRLEGDTTE